ncbi:iron ABC transporter permease [Laribacter hongkongensis]|uniref:FecCD family ABC transporter permease n=1 Tax=Laribacter hongkongensis TaxID=168471 RepID=UPI001EFD7B30|nr:iron ABC transporter permease [Laribacter hongkongensis]MCG8994305.1 iron ABC transporter permease [Laribacter hongkongensis]MCG9009102.1 iron ABC transporter permease [Laribacter hongkongensis]MCG9045993.1 iron ABC transporter permease [Laribacter hongkongensis]MCG9072613.1 iron ABC transporter permease [Laribacter hongkongensis]
MPIAPARLALILAGLLLLVSLASLLLGAGATIDELWHGDPFAWSLVLQLRAPRLVLALAAGSLLALCGASLQAQFRNPLAEPGLIGVSAGAALGAALALAASAPFWLVLPASLAGALTATHLAQRLARHSGNATELLLAGVAINAFAAALLTLVISFADDQSLRGITFWLMGSLALADWPLAAGLALVAVTGLALLWPRWRLLNALLLGERTAFHAGFAVARERRMLVWLTATLVALTISLTGGIGFIGLIVPQLVRRLSGGHYRQLLPLSALGGGLLLALADLLARLAVAPAELPVGAITSLAGAPFFLWLLRQRRGLC